MTEYIDKTEAMRRFKPFGREIPKDQVMAVLARIDEGIVRCKDCRWYEQKQKNLPYNVSKRYCNRSCIVATKENDFCSYGERSEE